MCVQKSHSQFNCASEIEQLQKPLRRCFSVLLTWGQHQIPWDLRLVVFVLCVYLWCFSSLYLQQYIPHKEWKQFYFIKPINLQVIWLFGAWLHFGSRTTCSSSCFRCSLPQLSPSQLKLGQNIFSALCCLQTSSPGLVRNSNLGAVAPPADKQGCSISISPPPSRFHAHTARLADPPGGLQAAGRDEILQVRLLLLRPPLRELAKLLGCRGWRMRMVVPFVVPL